MRCTPYDLLWNLLWLHRRFLAGFSALALECVKIPDSDIFSVNDIRVIYDGKDKLCLGISKICCVVISRVVRFDDLEAIHFAKLSVI